LKTFEPDVFLVDNFPLGTRHELLPSLRDLRHRPTRTVLGLRDVVDPPEKVRHDWGRDGIYEIIERYYDRVLVYGGREILDAALCYGLSPAIAQRLAYCGYVAGDAPTKDSSESIRRELGFDNGYFLATVGGGGDGRPLLEAFLRALDSFPARPALVVAGEFMALADRAAITEAAKKRPGVVVHDYIANLPAAMAAADLVVAMGGYNTSAEIVASGARAVLVPRTWRAGEHGSRGKTGVDAEQCVRAEGLARMGMVTVLDTEELSSESLANAMARAIEKPKQNGTSPLRLDGASTVAEHLLELATAAR
jgi:predicted glycosyltransferase